MEHGSGQPTVVGAGPGATATNQSGPAFEQYRSAAATPPQPTEVISGAGGAPASFATDRRGKLVVMDLTDKEGQSWDDSPQQAQMRVIAGPTVDTDTAVQPTQYYEPQDPAQSERRKMWIIAGVMTAMSMGVVLAVLMLNSPRQVADPSSAPVPAASSTGLETEQPQDMSTNEAGLVPTGGTTGASSAASSAASTAATQPSATSNPVGSTQQRPGATPKPVTPPPGTGAPSTTPKPQNTPKPPPPKPTPKPSTPKPTPPKPSTPASTPPSSSASSSGSASSSSTAAAPQ